MKLSENQRVLIFPDICFSLQLFHFMTNKIIHHDRNGQFARNFFHCEVMILS